MADREMQILHLMGHKWPRGNLIPSHLILCPRVFCFFFFRSLKTYSLWHHQKTLEEGKERASEKKGLWEMGEKLSKALCVGNTYFQDLFFCRDNQRCHIQVNYIIIKIPYCQARWRQLCRTPIKLTFYFL